MIGWIAVSLCGRANNVIPAFFRMEWVFLLEGDTDAVYDSINKGTGILSAESLSNIYCFIDGDSWWDILAVEEFIHRNPYDVAIDSGHAADLPVFGETLNQGINLMLKFSCAFNQSKKERLHIFRDSKMLTEQLNSFRCVALVHLDLEKSLHGKLS